MRRGLYRSEGFGERLLGTMIERAHEMPPQLGTTSDDATLFLLQWRARDPDHLATISR